ncbi:hypothetical protein [Crocosphaera sp. XPORK-15E]|uniref:hypothetical protein n=1 Tax=Crocosphaera sp. XPORK-15E TaxID=3110247 RepID=UPI002B1FE5AD|nr:hypothetical protein [Crocosphaera sp. XPORK-15E]MEA5533614.1 hypothetical protein [Crocosphaera sp. XPORK-15E]
MNNISIDELEQKIEAGEEIIDRYFDDSTTRVGTPHEMIPRRKQNFIITNIDLPQSMVNELDTMATELKINREAVIKMMLRRSLDEHYIAKNRL